MAAYVNNQAVSLYDKNIVYPLSPGSVESDSTGIYLGSSREFCIDYYSGLTEYPDVLLSYEFNEEDLLRGDPNHPMDELLVSQTKLVGHELV